MDAPITLIVDFPLMMIGVVIESWRSAGGEPTLLFVRMLARQGLSLTQAEEAAGLAGVAGAARRCAACGARNACSRALRWGWLGFTAPPCPNAGYFA